MTNTHEDFNDPLLDVMLEELLGDTAPPDLSSEILAQLGHQTVDLASQINIDAQPARRQSSFIPSLSLALSAAACILAVVAIVLNAKSTHSPQSHEEVVADSSPPSDAGNLTPNQLANDQNRQEQQDQPEQQMRPDGSTPFEQPKPIAMSDDNSVNPESITVPELTPATNTWKHPLAFVSTSKITPLSQSEVLAGISHELNKQWNEQGIIPSEFATNTEWVRRIYLRLLGRVPTSSELMPFLEQDVTEQTREALVNRLLFSTQYSEEYLQYWTNLWTNTLIGRHGGTGKDKAHREGLAKYLYDSLQINKPYNQIVSDLISATGKSHPDAEGFNGAVNFLLAATNEDDTTLATSRTTSLFLGQKLQCAQCHNHPSSDIGQNQFWEMDAYFSQLEIVALGKEKTAGYELLNTDFRGVETPNGDAGNYFEQPNGVARLAFPAFLGHAEASASGAIENFDRRGRLASLVSNSPLLERTLVNRMWSHFFGYGFTTEVEDMGPHVQITHPQLLQSLANQTRANKYNLKLLLKWIALSDPFLRSSVYSKSNDIDSPELGDQPLFSRYYSRQLDPEEVYQSLLVLSGKTRKANSFGQQQLAQRSWLGQFTRQMETDEGEETNTFKGDIHQSLVLMNGDLMKQVTSLEEDTVLKRIVASQHPTQEKVRQLFLASLARYPSDEELNQIKQLSVEAKVAEQQFLQDIWWALLNSSEFILDH